MPRRHTHRRTMKGGFLDTLSSWGTSLTQGASSLWEKTKQATSSAASGLTSSTPTQSYIPTTTVNTQPASQSMSYGGKTRRRRMRGGFKDNTPTTGLASHAASFSGETAKPHTIVGGKTRRHKRKGKSHRKH